MIGWFPDPVLREISSESWRSPSWTVHISTSTCNLLLRSNRNIPPLWDIVESLQAWLRIQSDWFQILASQLWNHRQIILIFSEPNNNVTNNYYIIGLLGRSNEIMLLKSEWNKNRFECLAHNPWDTVNTQHILTVILW